MDGHFFAMQRQPRTQQNRLAALPSSLCLPVERQRGEVAPGLPQETLFSVLNRFLWNGSAWPGNGNLLKRFAESVPQTAGAFVHR